LKFKKVKVRAGSMDPPKCARHTSVYNRNNNKMYVFGGFDGRHQIFGLSVLDLEKLTWEMPECSGEIPQPRTNHAAALVDDFMYVHGGNVSAAPDHYQTFDDFHCLNTKTLTWKIVPQFGKRPPKMSGHKLVPIGEDKLYLIGGGEWTPYPLPKGEWKHKYTDVYCFDIRTCFWTKIETHKDALEVCTFSMPCAIGDFIFLFGGQNTNSEFCSNVLMCFDTVARDWHKIDPNQANEDVAKVTKTVVENGGFVPKKRDIGCLTVLGNKLLLFGGSSGVAVNDVDVLSVPNSFFSPLKSSTQLSSAKPTMQRHHRHDN